MDARRGRARPRRCGGDLLCPAARRFLRARQRHPLRPAGKDRTDSYALGRGKHRKRARRGALSRCGDGASALHRRGAVADRRSAPCSRRCGGYCPGGLGRGGVSHRARALAAARQRRGEAFSLTRLRGPLRGSRRGGGLRARRRACRGADRRCACMARAALRRKHKLPSGGTAQRSRRVEEKRYPGARRHDGHDAEALSSRHDLCPPRRSSPPVPRRRT